MAAKQMKEIQRKLAFLTYPRANAPSQPLLFAGMELIDFSSGCFSSCWVISPILSAECARRWCGSGRGDVSDTMYVIYCFWILPYHLAYLENGPFDDPFSCTHYV
ncbi:putative plant AUGMIN subunit 7 protein [Helianthus annuus]|nr:putative plant AUGMIN subunit 7 protein [Helianthus annuus]